MSTSDTTTPAPCYVCRETTHDRLRRVWVVDRPGDHEDGQVLLPGTPLCHHNDDPAAGWPSCWRQLYGDTSSPDALADKIRSSHIGYMAFPE